MCCEHTHRHRWTIFQKMMGSPADPMIEKVLEGAPGPTVQAVCGSWALALLMFEGLAMATWADRHCWVSSATLANAACRGNAAVRNKMEVPRMAVTLGVHPELPLYCVEHRDTRGPRSTQVDGIVGVYSAARACSRPMLRGRICVRRRALGQMSTSSHEAPKVLWRWPGPPALLDPHLTMCSHCSNCPRLHDKSIQTIFRHVCERSKGREEKSARPSSSIVQGCDLERVSEFQPGAEPRKSYVGPI